MARTKEKHSIVVIILLVIVVWVAYILFVDPGMITIR